VPPSQRRGLPGVRSLCFSGIGSGVPSSDHRGLPLNMFYSRLPLCLLCRFTLGHIRQLDKALRAVPASVRAPPGGQGRPGHASTSTPRTSAPTPPGARAPTPPRPALHPARPACFVAEFETCLHAALRRARPTPLGGSFGSGRVLDAGSRRSEGEGPNHPQRYGNIRLHLGGWRLDGGRPRRDIASGFRTSRIVLLTRSEGFRSCRCRSGATASTRPDMCSKPSSCWPCR
jgi:hypothetical protein